MRLIKHDPYLCIDPGPKVSGACLFDGVNIDFVCPEIDNDELLYQISLFKNFEEIEYMVIEGVASYGMAVGMSVFDTVEWIGRFRQAFGFDFTHKVYRKDVKLFLCGSPRAKDANIRQRIIDIFPATGGGKRPQIGTNKEPGPLYGVSKHAWSALAVGLTYIYGCETHKTIRSLKLVK